MAKIRPSKPEWVRIPEAARLLNVDRRTVEKLVAEGKLRSRTDLGLTLIKYADIESPPSDQDVSHGSWCSTDSADPVVLEAGA